jgi:hypothetical protein
MAAELTGLTHKIAIQLHLEAESCNVCNLAPGGQSGNFWIHSRKAIREKMRMCSAYYTFIERYVLHILNNSLEFSEFNLIYFLQCCSSDCTETLTHPLTHSLTHSMVQDIICKADFHSACQRISCFLYGTRRFITVFTKARHWTLS